jgi:predicted transcriptional regulator of viral defense system
MAKTVTTKIHKSRQTKLLRLDIAKSDIVAAFEDLPTDVLTIADIERIFAQNRQNWRVSRATKVEEFLTYLLDKTQLTRAEFPFPGRKETRYVWGEVPLYSLVLSLRAKSYFSHYSAVYLHQLTEQAPKAIYLNAEQTPKPVPKGPLAQDRIDVAFRSRQRITTNIGQYGEFKIHLLSGKFTNQLGVVDFPLSENYKVRVTDLERTLIDIAVRPLYAGGPFEVLKAYRLAKPYASINRLTATLKRLEYVYPYHQAIGFYLERAGGYPSAAIDILRKMEIKYDFYLTHQIRDPEYSKEWKLYYPKGL